MGIIMKNGVSYAGGESAESSKIIELTQNEYDALDNSKFRDNIIYFITDGYNYDTNTIKNIISFEYSKTKKYKFGDLCFKDNLLYMCVSETEITGEWNAAYWSNTTIGEVLSVLYKFMRS